MTTGAFQQGELFDEAVAPRLPEPPLATERSVPASWDEAADRLRCRSHGASYRKAFASLRHSAEGAGLGPAELGGGFEALVAARRWRPATEALYRCVASYAGIPLARASITRPRPVQGALSWLTVPAGEHDLSGCRAVAWLSAAAGWPASLSWWQRLRLEDIAVSGAGVRFPGRYLPGVAGAWQAWLRARERSGIAGLAESGWALCALGPGRVAGGGPGASLAPRSLQAAFRAHARRAAAAAAEAGATPDAVGELARMTYDTFRRASIERGVAPVDRGPGAGRLTWT